MPVNMRIARPGDANHIYRLHTRSVRLLCKETYESEQLDGWLQGKTPEGYLDGISKGEMIVAEKGGQIVGFGHAIPGEVLACFVHPSFVRQGVGRALMGMAVPMAQGGYSTPVKVVATLNAVQFYEKMGFLEVGRDTLRCGDAELAVVNMVAIS